MGKQVTPTYQEQQKQNEEMFYTLLQRIRPDLYVLSDMIDKNSINIFVLMKFIRQLLNVARGTGWGKVHVFIQEGKVIRMEGVDAEEIREDIVTKTEKEGY